MYLFQQVLLPALLIIETNCSVVRVGDCSSAPAIEYIFVESSIVPSISSTPKDNACLGSISSNHWPICFYMIEVIHENSVKLHNFLNPRSWYTSGTFSISLSLFLNLSGIKVLKSFCFILYNHVSRFM